MSKRSLILAGGGLKVGYQAGVLQVWLDEAGLKFDHADGASGGCFNLAMSCQGMSGRRIADNWRTLDPFLPVDVNLAGLWPTAPSLFTHDNLRARVLPVLEDRLQQDPPVGEERHVQRLQFLEEAERGPSALGDDRGFPRRVGLAADVVPAGHDQR